MRQTSGVEKDGGSDAQRKNTDRAAAAVFVLSALLIETYYSREGRYPQDLPQLTTRYVLSLSGPVIINGQGWCYDGGNHYYRLGYVYREHWKTRSLPGGSSKPKEKLLILTPSVIKKSLILNFLGNLFHNALSTIIINLSTFSLAILGSYERRPLCQNSKLSFNISNGKFY